MSSSGEILAQRPIVNSAKIYSASDPATRKKYVAVVEAVQQKGGEVLIFSSMHESGQREIYFWGLY
jgi:stalled ribosome rescue protein Dom34